MITARLPYDQSRGAVLVTQGAGGETSHSGHLTNSWDFGVPFGTDILAIADGWVINYYDAAGDGEMGPGNAGNLVTIRHAGGYSSVFHLTPNSIPAWIKQIVDAGGEAPVGQGQLLGTVGNTGDTRGAHLHLTVGADTIPWGASTGHSELIADGSAPGDATALVQFLESPGNLPMQGDSLTSSNARLDASGGEEATPAVLDLGSLAPEQGFRLDGAAGLDGTGGFVAPAGDVNGDGYDDFLIGANAADFNGRPGSGSVYVIYGKAAGFAGIDLASLSPTDGFRIDGAGASDNTGRSLAAAGDFNKDGFDDIIIGAPFASYTGYRQGASYLIFGQHGLSPNIDLANLAPSDGFRIDGAAGDVWSGLSVSGAGDINRDGFDDVIIGSPRTDHDGWHLAGAAHVVFGHDDTPSNISLAALTPSQGFRMGGETGSYSAEGFGGHAGYSVAGAGDVNGDGIDDVLVGAAYLTTYNPSGSAYVVYGKRSGWADFDLADMTRADGFRVDSSSALGGYLTSAGDFNGDGLADIIFASSGSNNGRPNAGAAFILFGKPGGYGNIDITTLTLDEGFWIQGGASGDYFPTSAAAAGDVNKDGYDDLIVASFLVDNNGRSNSGSSYLIYGKATGHTDIDLASLAPSQGRRFDGAAANDQSGSAVSSAGDVNRDGYADLLIGAGFTDPQGRTDSGSAYLVFGGPPGSLPEVPTLPSDEALEYFARVTAYKRGLFYDAAGTPETGVVARSAHVAAGYEIDEEFSLGTFYAVALSAAGKAPVLAIRGTTGALLDWYENADFRGVGYSEVDAAWGATGLGAWLALHPNVSIVGHSQAGAQAQIVAARATDLGVQLGKVFTFNAAGVSHFVEDLFDPSKAALVRHYISSGDIVSHAGAEFIPGQVIYYNFDSLGSSSLPLDLLGDAHTAYWAQQNLYTLIDGDGISEDIESERKENFDPNVNFRLTASPLTEDRLSSPHFSHIHSGGEIDVEFLTFLNFIARVGPRIADGSNALSLLAPPLSPVLSSIGATAAVVTPTIAALLATRGGAEALRTGLGVVGEGAEITFGVGPARLAAAKAVFDLIMELGHALQDIALAIATEVAEAVETMLHWAAHGVDVLANLSVAAWEGLSTWSLNQLAAARDYAAEAVETITHWTAAQWEGAKGWTEARWAELEGMSAELWTEAAGWGKATLQKVGQEGLAGLAQVRAKVTEIKNSLDDATAQVIDQVETLWDFITGGDEPTVLKAEVGVPLSYSGTGRSVILDSLGADTLTNRAGNGFFTLSGGGDRVEIGNGGNTVFGLVGGLNNDTIDGFGTTDKGYLGGVRLSLGDLFLTKGSAIIEADTDGDGALDFRLTLAGSFRLSGFVVEQENGGTIIRYLGNAAPVVTEAIADQESLVDRAFSFVLPAASFAELDEGDSLTLTAMLDNGEALPAWLGFDAATRSFAGNVPAGAAGDLAIRVTATDTGDQHVSDVFLLRLLTPEQAKDMKLGGADGDSLRGGVGDDTLDGLAGDDLLDGGSENDLLLGGPGADTLLGGPGNDEMTGGTGVDRFEVDAGTDTITDLGLGGADVLAVAAGATALARLGAEWIAPATVTNAGTVHITAAGFGVTLSALALSTGAWSVSNAGNAAGVVFRGSSHAEELTGGEGRDTLIGGAGDDSLSGNGDRDSLLGGVGRDSLAGGAGDDTLLGEADQDSLAGGAGNDSLGGGDGNDTLLGEADQDSLSGGQGDDRMTGGLGVDRFAVDAGTDTITDLGQGGADLLVISAGAVAHAALVANWTLTAGNNNSGQANITAGGFNADLTLAAGGSGWAVFNLGTNRAVTLIGSARNDTLTGGNGVDTLNGGGGNDNLLGSAGNDSLTGGTGNDMMTGGAGVDRFVVDAGTDTITDLASGGNDLLIVAAGAVANATLAGAWTASANTSNAGQVSLTATGFNVNLSAATGPATGLWTVSQAGQAGAVVFTGSALRDRLTGGLGQDSLLGNTGDDTLTGGDGGDTLIGGAGVDSLVGGLGDDLLTGGLEVDRFLVEAGTDTITDLGAGGTDALVIQAGAAVVATMGGHWTASSGSSNAGSASIAAAGYNVNLSAVTGTAGWVLGNAHLRGVSLIGSGQADTITGGSGADTLRGQAGADSLAGGAGNDQLFGGAGNDSMTGGAGIDRFAVDAGMDVVTDLGAGGGDVLIISAGAMVQATLAADWVATAASSNVGTANLAASGFDVSLAAALGTMGWDVSNAGEAAAVTLTGSARADSLAGGLGADTLSGGAGEDTLIGGGGADRLTGGLGADSFRFGSAEDASGDVITDFRASQGDKLDFRLMDADAGLAGDQAFAFLGAGAFTGAVGQLRFAGGTLEGDLDGDGVADFQIGLTGVATLSAGGLWL